MFRKNDGHLQQSFFNSINELPDELQKRLENSWAGVFYDEIFIHIDEGAYAVLYADIPSRPNVPVNILVAVEILKAGQGWSDEELYDNVCYNIQTRYALGLHTLGEAYFCMRTIYTFRQRLMEHMQETGQNLFEETFERVTEALVSAKVSRHKVEFSKILTENQL